jgi:hypothetical protein
MAVTSSVTTVLDHATSVVVVANLGTENRDQMDGKARTLRNLERYWWFTKALLLVPASFISRSSFASLVVFLARTCCGVCSAKGPGYTLVMHQSL